MAYRDEREAMRARIEELERELRDARASLAGRKPLEPPAPNAWFGAPLRIAFEEEIAGEISEGTLEEIVSIIRRDTGQLGRIDRLGGTLAWSIGPSRDASAQTPEFTCELRDGRIRLRLAESQRGMAGGLFGGIVGGVGGGSLGIWIPLMATQLISPLLGLALVALWLALVWWLVRLVFAAVVRRRHTKLSETFTRITETVERDAKPARVAVPQRVETDAAAEAEADALAEQEAAERQANEQAQLRSRT